MTNDATNQPSYLEQAHARATWLSLVDALDTTVQRIQRFGQIFDDAEKKGFSVSYLEPAFQQWLASAQALLDQIVALIVENTSLQTFIDNVAGANDAGGLQGLRSGAWREFVSELRRPGTQALNGLGWLWLVRGASAVGRVLANPAVWMGVKELLIKMTPWVAGTLITDNLESSISSATGNSSAQGDRLELCFDALQAAHTPEERAQAERVCSAVGSANNSLMLLLLGGAAGVGAFVYFSKKNRVQSRLRRQT